MGIPRKEGTRMAKASLAEVKQRVVRFKEVPPLKNAYEETQLPAHERVLYRYFGNQASDAKDVPAAVEGIGLNVALATAEPGKGAPLHDHECEEIFVVMRGAFEIAFGENGEEKVVLHEWDAISVPSGIHRAWRNVGPPDGCIMAILAAGKTELPRYRGDYSNLPEVVKRKAPS
jgi:mannose-6-phosphate isomerase-like protein (cupin superfamily)